MILDRRKFLKLFAALAAIGGSSLYLASRNTQSLDTLALLGEKFIKEHPEIDFENFSQKLKNENFENLVIEISKQVQEDFRNQSITYIDGWQLSLTELKLCAAYATSLS